MADQTDDKAEETEEQETEVEESAEDGSEEATDEESEEESEDEAKPEEEKKTAKAEPSESDKRLATLEADLQAERTARERSELIARRAQLAHDRLAGEFSRLKSGVKAKSKLVEDDGEEGPDPDAEAARAEAEEDARSSLMNEVEYNFVTTHSDIMPMEDDAPEVKKEKLAFVEEIKKELSRLAPSYRSDLLSGSPKRMRAAANDSLREAYLTVKERKERTRADEIAGRRKVAEETNRQVKKLVTPVGTRKTTSTARPPADPKKMSVEQLEAEFHRQGRRGF